MAEFMNADCRHGGGRLMGVGEIDKINAKNFRSYIFLFILGGRDFARLGSEVPSQSPALFTSVAEFDPIWLELSKSKRTNTGRCLFSNMSQPSHAVDCETATRFPAFESSIAFR